MILALLICVSNVACSAETEDKIEKIESGICFVDVGNGDATLIKTKNLVVLIDCGKDETVSEVLRVNGVTKIDYFILSHFNLDYVGAVECVLQDFQVLKGYLPYVTNQKSLDYLNVYSIFNRYGVPYSYTDSSFKIEDSSSNFSTYCLSPLYYGATNNEYAKLNVADYITAEMMGDISPIFYIEFMGYRIVHCSATTKSVEEKVYKNYNDRVYDFIHTLSGNGINLKGIDLLKLSGGGSVDCVSSSFLRLLSPKHAIISVDGSKKNCPSHQIIYCLKNYNKDVSICRTDECGNVYVEITNNLSVITQNLLQKF